MADRKQQATLISALPIGKKVSHFTVSRSDVNHNIRTRSSPSCPSRTERHARPNSPQPPKPKTMAALVRHGAFKTAQIITPKNVLHYATGAKKGRKIGPKIDASAESLAAKGFLRPQKDYSPPEDVNDRLAKLFQNSLGSVELGTRLDDLSKRFELFNASFEEFGHGIPNSLLYTMQTLGDVRNFYLSPVSSATPLDKMKNMTLPPNLHVQYEYHRFHPDTDTKFGGLSAFPRSSTIITGLKYKDKYKGHIQNQSWPYSQ